MAVRYVAANSHPDHDTIARFRRDNAAAFSTTFEHVLLLASETDLLKLGTVSVAGTGIDANAARVKSVRYDRIQALRDKLAEDIAALMAQAGDADSTPEDDGLSLPVGIARRDDDDDNASPSAADKPTNLSGPDSAVMRKIGAPRIPAGL